MRSCYSCGKVEAPTWIRSLPYAAGVAEKEKEKSQPPLHPPPHPSLLQFGAREDYKGE